MRSLYATELAAIERIGPETEVSAAEFKIAMKSLYRLMVAAEDVLSLFGMDRPDSVHALAQASAEAGYDIGHLVGEPTSPVIDLKIINETF
jgi:hypothetical protein